MTQPSKAISNKILRGVLTVTGFGCTALGVLGIFLPLLPTVPLLLLATACFARSSERFHRWILEHPYLGLIIQDYLNGQGIPPRAKFTAIGMIWVSIPVSIFFIPIFHVKIFLVMIGVGVTIYLWRLPVCEDKD